jgi:hypothetical protein
VAKPRRTHGRASSGSEDDLLVSEIFGLDRRIRFCAVVDSHAQVVAGGIRPGVQPLVPKEAYADIAFRTFLGSKAIQASEDYLGTARFGIIRRDKILQMVFVLPNDRELQIGTEVGFPLDRVNLIEGVIKKLTSSANPE